MMKRILMILVAGLFTTAGITQPLMMSKEHYRANFDLIKGNTAACGPGKTTTEISLNNVRTIIHTGGDMW